MPVQEIAETDVVTVQRDADVAEIVERMDGENVGSVVVVDDDSPVGVVTDRTIALAAGDGDVTGEVADDLMSENLVTVTDDDGIFEVVRTMSQEGIRRIPVVDDQGTLEGIVTLDDAIVVLATEFGNVGDVIEKQSPRF